MNDIARGLSDKVVRDLAEYFSKRPFEPARQGVNAELARHGEMIHERSCEKCHTDGGAHSVEDASILAGQWMP